MTCKVCAGEWPSKDHKIADRDLAAVYLFEDQFFPGWTVLVLKRHATELFELTQSERGRLIEEVSRVATALAMAFEPVKLNYELLGTRFPTSTGISSRAWRVIRRRRSPCGESRTSLSV